MKALFLLACLAAPSVYATYGVDVSQYTDVFGCLKNDSYDFAIVRGYQSNGYIDHNVLKNIQNARNAGIPYVDVYMFPDVPANNGAQQAADLVNYLKSNGADYGTIWVDIENYAWSGSHSANQNFIMSVVNQLKSMGQRVGIYTSYYNWESIVGLSWSGVSDLPLWYAHYDGNASFSDFTPFGGWSRPAIKQYAGDKTVCGTGVDLNFY